MLWRSRRGRGAALLSVVGLVLAYFAASYDGTPTADLHLNDGGIWVTGHSQNIGRLNYYAHELDAGATVGEGLLDISQHDNVVLAHVPDGFRVLDPARVSLGEVVKTPKDAEVLLGGDGAAVVDRVSGRIWALPARELRSFSADAPPTIAGPAGTRATIAVDGTLLAVAPDGQIRMLAAADGHAPAAAGRLTGYTNPAHAVLTAVGQNPAAYDRDTGLLWLPGRDPVALDKGLVLQEPGPDAPDVRLASPTALVSVPIVEGSPSSLLTKATTAGKPARPVVVGSCTYAAWAGSGGYIRDCADSAADRNLTQPALLRAVALRFRVNRGLVVLNDVASGSVLLDDEFFTVVDDWERVLRDGQGADEGDTTEEEDNNRKPDAVNDPPVAKADDFGVRVGKAITLDVLANDSDGDGDILTVEPTSRLDPGFGRVAPIRAGEALQVLVSDDARGSASFQYAVVDGRGGKATAKVSLHVHGAGQNQPPEKLREPRPIRIAPGGSGSYYVLPDWVDPDGDDMWISTPAGQRPAGGLDVTVRQDGLVTVRDLTGESGERQTQVSVVDARQEQTTSTLRVSVVKGSDHPPTAVPDHRRVLVGQAIEIAPLLNDTDPDGDELALASVAGAGANTTVTPNLAAGRFSFSADKPGTYYQQFAVTDGPNEIESFARIDVVEPVTRGTPAAEPDIALLPQGASVLADVLANDFDPQGGVLVVRSVTSPDTVTVEVVDHAQLRLSAPGGLATPATVTYLVSNGPANATGTVTVMPTPDAGTEPPEAADDTGTVRAGDVVNLDVTANDTIAPGARVSVDPEVEVTGGRGRGEFFVTGNRVRFKAGAVGGRVRGTYTIRDDRDQFASATVTIEIRDAKSGNSAPAPTPLTARMIAGTTVTIPVPTDGIDPDGDSTSLAALTKAPTKGTVLIEGGDLVYTAPASPPGQVGTDQFSYEVVDQLGLRGTGTVQVGIAKPPEVNQTPVAVVDHVTIRPNTEVAIPILANDFDSDGDHLQLVAGSLRPVSAGQDVPIAEVDGYAQLTTPAAEGKLDYYYVIADAKGARARGAITVDVDQDAKPVAPLAHDDAVPVADAQGKTEVSIDVLANDEDADGVPSRLSVTTREPGVRVAGGSLTIPITEQRQLIIYKIADTDGLVSSAIVVVPGVPRASSAGQEEDRTPPRLRADKVPVHVTAGQSIDLALEDYVQVRAGRSPHVTSAKTVSAVGAGSTAVAGDRASVTYTASRSFSGLGSISFEVTDASSATDDTALTALLSIPVQVSGIRNIAPTFQGSEVTLQAGATTTLALRPLVTDPDPGDQDKLRFDMVGSRGAVQASIVNGSTLSVRADQDASAGSAAVEMTVSDGTNKPVHAWIRIQIVAVDRPLMTVTPAVFPDVTGPITVDITDYVTNPFADEGGTLLLAADPIVTAGTGGATRAGPTTIRVTPDPNFHGTMRVVYRVDDQTRDVSRRVTGTIELTVLGKPDPPVGVTAGSDAPGSAQVSWTPGANNGSPITEFTVRWSGGSSPCGAVTSCRVDGLTNGVEYRFTVVATNARGDSLPSAPSNAVTPRDAPDTPAAPSAEPGDSAVELTWPVPDSGGGDITGYTVQMNPGGDERSTTTNSLRWSGLDNGSSYRFRVKARSEGGTSEYSEYSAAVTPAGPPGAPRNVRATLTPGDGGDPVVTVSWSAADGHGATPDSYTVFRAGTSTPLFTGNALSAEIRVAVSPDPVSFTVQAHNVHGSGPMSKPSAPLYVYTTPGAPTGVSATPTGQDNTVRITFTPGSTGGADPADMSYFWKVGEAKAALPAGGGTVTSYAFPNGTEVGVVVYAVARLGTAGSETGPPSDPALVNAYGPPHVPSVSATPQTDGVLLGWNAEGAGNGRPIVSVTIKTTMGGLDKKTDLSGAVLEGDPGQTVQIQAMVTDSEGNQSAWSDPASATVPTVTGEWTLEQTSPPENPADCGAKPDCFKVTLALRHWGPYVTVTCQVPAMGWTVTRTVNQSGFSAPGGMADGGVLMVAWADSGLTYGQNSDSVTCT
ncbi:MAG: Ig-like domain-containing protein [Tetrasphaera sp.]